MFPKMYRRARSHLAQDKRAITTDYLLAFFSTMSFSELQLSHGALPKDYEWSAVQQDWKCLLCYRIASDDHCRSEAHANRVQWYGAAAMQRQQQELQSMGIVPVVSGPGNRSPAAVTLQQQQLQSMAVLSGPGSSNDAPAARSSSTLRIPAFCMAHRTACMITSPAPGNGFAKYVKRLLLKGIASP